MRQPNKVYLNPFRKQEGLAAVAPLPWNQEGIVSGERQQALHGLPRDWREPHETQWDLEQQASLAVDWN